MKPQEIVHAIKDRADAARAAADAQQDSERCRGMVDPLADALDLVTDLLIQQQRFLIDLRNWKADAPR